MKNYIFIEFVFSRLEANQVYAEIKELGNDFVIGDRVVKSGYCIDDHCVISGAINSATATMLKLSNPFLANRMNISYISDELKDKYRDK